MPTSNRRGFLLFLKVLFLLCTFCKRNWDEKFSSSDFANAELIIIDSILLQPDSLLYLYYNMEYFKKGYIVTIDNSGQIYLLGSNGSLINKIGTKGNLPENYSLPVGISFLSIDSIFVADYHSGKIFLFNKQGNYINDWKVIKNDTLNTFTVFYNYLGCFKDSLNNLVFEYLGRSDKLFFITDPLYYRNARLLTIYNPHLNQYKHYIPYEEGSPYLGNEYFLSPLDPRILKLPNKWYAVVFAHDDHIYLYDGHGNFIQRIEGKSGNFPKAKGVSFAQRDKQFGIDYVRYNIKQNALNYLSLNSFYHNDTILIIAKQYEAPVGDKNLPDDLNTLKYTYYKRDSYLQFYDITGKKIFNDIRQPSRLRQLIFAESFDYLIFRSDPKLTEKNILYVTKLRY